MFRYLGEISAEITRKDDPECPPYVLASPMIYLTRNKNSENACCTEQMFGYFEGDLVKAVDAYYELDACADRRGLVERIINRQRLPVEEKGANLDFPDILFVLCTVDAGFDDLPYVCIRRGSKIMWAPSDRGSGTVKIYRTKGLKIDNRAAEAVSVLGQLLALCRRANNLRASQSIRLV